MSLFLTVAAILGLAALFSFVNERLLGLEQTIGLVVIAFGAMLVLALLNALGVTRPFALASGLVDRLALDDTLLDGVLCFLLFAGSINVKARTLGQEKWVILSLGVGSTLIGALLVGVAMWTVLAALGVSLALAYALAFGALISPTDPVAALAILGKVGLPAHLEAILDGESLFNDGVGVVLFSICVSVVVGVEQPTALGALALFLREVAGGIALGLVASVLLHIVLVRLEDYGTQVLCSLAVVALAYGVAQEVEVSGPLATVVLGLVIGNYSMARLPRRETAPFKTFWQAIDEILNAMLFVLVGLHLATAPAGERILPMAIAVLVVCLAARWLSVYLPIRLLVAAGTLHAQSVGLTNLPTWGGLRGGLAMAMALSLPDGPQKDVVLYLTAIVAFSIVVQGLTVHRLFTAEQLKALVRTA